MLRIIGNTVICYYPGLGLAWDPELLYVASIAATLLFVRQGEYVAKFSVMHCRQLKINKYPGRRKMAI